MSAQLQPAPFSYYVPKFPLSDFVDVLWIYEGYSAAHSKERLLPTGTMELVIGLDDDDRIGAAVSGPRSEFTVLDTSKPFSVLGVHFKPGGGFPFFGAPAGEFQDLGISLDLVWGAYGRDLRDRLRDTKTHSAKFRILEDALLERGRGELASHPAVRFALKAFNTRDVAIPVAAVTDQIGLSARRFIDLFRSEVGLSPKLYSRIRRFQNVVATIHKLDQPELADIALACGYFDQAHFIHDFRSFAGISPSAYLRNRTAASNHVAILG